MHPLAISPTGRLTTSQPQMQYLGSARGRMSMPVPLTPKQRALLASLVDNKTVVCGREFTRAQLMSCFKGEQLPKDPAVCEALDLSRGLSADYSALELRVLAQGDVKTPYGS